MKLQTPLARVLGLGSAREGVEHWWWQRVTAIALVPLSIWFIYSLLHLLGQEQTAARSWLASPINSSLALLFVLAVFHHAQLGIQVVIEDYVANEGRRMLLVIVIKFVAAFMLLLTILSILKVSFS
jgi:succinate dehydrogenase / fumarate reductase membrane anchor subunit